MKLRVFGRTIPTWLLLGGLVMAASGAGVGTILAGSVVGEMPVTVSQTVLVGVPFFPDNDDDWTDNFGNVRGVIRDTFTDHHAKPDRSIGVRSDDKTGFQAAAEVDQGDKYLVQVCFKNASDQDAVVRFELDFPKGIEVEIFGSDEEKTATGVGDDGTLFVTRTGAHSWKFVLDDEADFRGSLAGGGSQCQNCIPKPWQDCLGIQIKADDTLPPGYYNIEARARQIAF